MGFRKFKDIRTVGFALKEAKIYLHGGRVCKRAENLTSGACPRGVLDEMQNDNAMYGTRPPIVFPTYKAN